MARKALRHKLTPSASNGSIIPKSAEKGWRQLISHLIWYTSWVDKSSSPVLRFRNKQASKPHLFPLLHPTQTQKENIHFIMAEFIYITEGLHKLKSCFNRNPTISAFVHLQRKWWFLRLHDTPSEDHDDHLGKKYQESTKTNKQKSTRVTLVLYNQTCTNTWKNNILPFQLPSLP